MLHPSRSISLSPSVSGKVRNVYLFEGDHVEAGQKLTSLEDEEELLLVERLELLVKKHAFDKRGLEDLLKKNMASQEDAMEASIEWELSRIDLANARRRLSDKQLSAPFNGTVTAIHKDVGEWLQPGEPFLELIHVDELHAVFYLPYPRAVHLSGGQSVELRFPQINVDRLDGEIFFISPEVDSSSGMVVVKARIDNRTGQLRPGISGKVILPPAPFNED